MVLKLQTISHGYLLELIFEFSTGFIIYKVYIFGHLTFEGKGIRLLVLDIWNHLSETWKAKSNFQIFERSLNDWFGSSACVK